ncbi:SAF domain-containing protein [Pseudogracilibacillus sp. SE30717A]|uniref:NAD(P)H-dependent oxidoreductase n=1 Tax=Pseudogracilibacillus sp. SE30717A TaxID=3098293 RepID=UPI00300E4F39
MIGINRKLAAFQKEGKRIHVGLVGAGQMGRGMVSQIEGMKGMQVSAIADINVEAVKSAFKFAGIEENKITSASSLEEANQAAENNQVVATNDYNILTKMDSIDVIVDATGVPDVGANVALQSILNKKHIVMLNVETDVTIGPLLYHMATSADVVYTGSAGDEPGSIMELYDFADAINFEIVALGKGKNNPLNLEATPDSVKEIADAKKANPKMIASFQDGTKTMVEMTAVANATGFVPDKPGMHGVSGTVKDLPKLLIPKEDGGIFSQKKVVEFVNGVAPGVFAIITSSSEEVNEELQYLNLGEGPYYVLYRPYHLASLETPLSVAKAFFDHEPTIAPMNGMVAETVAVAKRDLKKGENLDEIGGYTVYGKIYKKEEAEQLNALPIGLVDHNVVVQKDIKKGEVITYDAVEQTKTSTIWTLRKLQDQQKY